MKMIHDYEKGFENIAGIPKKELLEKLNKLIANCEEFIDTLLDHINRNKNHVDTDIELYKDPLEFGISEMDFYKLKIKEIEQNHP